MIQNLPVGSDINNIEWKTLLCDFLVLFIDGRTVCSSGDIGWYPANKNAHNYSTAATDTSAEQSIILACKIVHILLYT